MTGQLVGKTSPHLTENFVHGLLIIETCKFGQVTVPQYCRVRGTVVFILLQALFVLENSCGPQTDIS